MLLGGKTFSITNFSYIVDNPIFIHQLQLPKAVEYKNMSYILMFKIIIVLGRFKKVATFS